VAGPGDETRPARPAAIQQAEASEYLEEGKPRAARPNQADCPSENPAAGVDCLTGRPTRTDFGARPSAKTAELAIADLTARGLTEVETHRTDGQDQSCEGHGTP